MKILRKSLNCREYLSDIRYVPSIYNITEQYGKMRLTFNTASSSVFLAEAGEISLLDFPLDELKILVNNGFYIPEGESEFSVYSSKVNEYSYKLPNYFTIIVTTICNARCFYCYEADYNKRSIDNEAEKLIVNYLARVLKDQNDFVLDWYGGEPLLCIDKIDSIILFLHKKINLSRYNWSSSITTNATLADHDLIDHMVKTWHLNMAHITIDGIESDHNNRKNVALDGKSAFKTTISAIENLLDAGVFVNLRIHLDNNNKHNFREIIRLIKRFFVYPNFRIFPTVLFPPENKMEDRYIKDMDKEKLFYTIFKIMKEEGCIDNYIDALPKPKLEGCYATSQNKIVIAPDGSLHSCVQEFIGVSWEGDEKFQNYISKCGGCINCEYFPICLGGCAHNRSLVGTARSLCVRNRFIIRPLLRLELENFVINKENTDQEERSV